jgi:hypothetical protein
MMHWKTYCLVTMLLLQTALAFSQHTSVFSLAKSDERLGDDYFKKQDYQHALELYQGKYDKTPEDTDLGFKIARCLYFLKRYPEAFQSYQHLAEKNIHFLKSDQFFFAEASVSTGDNITAADIYRDLLNRFPGDTIVAQKLWRINNIQYLYEDSIYYVVSAVDKLNSTGSDIAVAAMSGQLFFVSDRPAVKLIEKIDAAGANFYNVYQSKRLTDTLSETDQRYARPVLFSGNLHIRSHAGPMSFYANGQKVVFTTTSDHAGDQGKHPLQLVFAEKINNTWRLAQHFPFNSGNYSVTDPSISNDGSVLYFSSDMPGGKGGKDIYRSINMNGNWTTPQNVAFVNTPFDDITPFYHQGKAIYFSSNGHPGMGGFDIFKVERRGEHWDEVTNVGYPVNSHADDFGMIIDSLGSSGYFSSNRKNNGLDDDIYSVEIDLQNYPITIASLVQIKEHSWSDSAALVPYANATFTLIDNVRNTTVYETTTGPIGAVSIVVPYFSKYKIKITGPAHDQHIAVFDIPKNRKVGDRLEIVLVRDIYESNELQSPQNKER